MVLTVPYLKTLGQILLSRAPIPVSFIKLSLTQNDRVGGIYVLSVLQVTGLVESMVKQEIFPDSTLAG